MASLQAPAGGGETKTFGIMGVIRGATPVVRLKNQEDVVPTWPHLVYRELVAFMGLSTVVLLLSVLFDAPLEGIANPAVTPNPAKAPWYFAGLQELLHYFPPLLAGITVPALMVLGLIALPYLDRNPSTAYRSRRLAIALWLIGLLTVAVLTIIGTFFRGPNWQWQWPWAI